MCIAFVISRMHFLTHYKITMQVEIITEGAFFSLKKSQVTFLLCQFIKIDPDLKFRLIFMHWRRKKRWLLIVFFFMCQYFQGIIDQPFVLVCILQKSNSWKKRYIPYWKNISTHYEKQPMPLSVLAAYHQQRFVFHFIIKVQICCCGFE